MNKFVELVNESLTLTEQFTKKTKKALDPKQITQLANILRKERDIFVGDADFKELPAPYPFKDIDQGLHIRFGKSIPNVLQFVAEDGIKELEPILIILSDKNWIFLTNGKVRNSSLSKNTYVLDSDYNKISKAFKKALEDDAIASVSYIDTPLDDVVDRGGFRKNSRWKRKEIGPDQGMSPEENGDVSKKQFLHHAVQDRLIALAANKKDFGRISKQLQKISEEGPISVSGLHITRDSYKYYKLHKKIVLKDSLPKGFDFSVTLRKSGSSVGGANEGTVVNLPDRLHTYINIPVDSNSVQCTKIASVLPQIAKLMRVIENIDPEDLIVENKEDQKVE